MSHVIHIEAGVWQNFRDHKFVIHYADDQELGEWKHRGAGKPKELDPERAPLVRLAFTSYATGEYPLRKLASLLNDTGLRNRAGGRVTISGLSILLRNPFYMGQIHLRKEDGLYLGVHRPLVTKELFSAVQTRLKARVRPAREASFQVRPDVPLRNLRPVARRLGA
jgi:hypothetical protein